MRTLTGTRPLLRASLRHDGRLLAPWVVILSLLGASIPLVYPHVFPTMADREGLAAALSSNPAIGLVFGPAEVLTTVDGFNVWRTLCLGGLLAGIGMALAVVRATRAQEDSGQAELLASGVMGRGARLATGVIMGTIGSLLCGVVPALATVLSGGGATASWLMCATWTVTGLMVTGLAAVAGELASDRRTASTITIGTLGALYALRGISYSLTLPDWTVWANPLGWMTEARAVSDARWWPLLLGVVLWAVLVPLAFVLLGRRDFGQGVIVPGPGPAVGRVRSALALVTRLNRAPAITWTLVAVLLGSVFGYMTASVADILSGNGAVQKVLASGATSQDQLTTAFLVTILSLLGIILSVPGVQIMLRVRSEEMEERLEPLLATSLSRRRYYAVQALVALGLAATLQVLAGVVLGIVAHAAGSTVTVGDATVQALATVPATLAVVAVSVMVIGARPKVSVASWAGVLLSLGLTLLGPSFKLPGWALGISPYHHVPNTSLDDATWTGLAVVGCVALALSLIGWAAFQRRDLARS